MQQQSLRTIGHIDTMTVDITEPIKMEAELKQRNISVMVGTNGSGKTLVLKLHFVMATMAAVYVEQKGVPDDAKQELVQAVFDATFVEQNFHGTIEAQFENGRIGVKLDKGTVNMLYIDVDNVDIATPTIYMSTELRLFSQIKQYLFTERLLKQHDPDNPAAILESYRLYDVMYVEMLKEMLVDGFNLPDKLRPALKSFGLDGYKWKSLRMDDVSVYIYNDKDEERDLATFSNGEQAMLNMLIGGLLSSP